MAGARAISVKEKKENATSVSWRASDEDVARIIAATHPDPFSILGLHDSPEGMVIRAFVPSVARLQALIEPDGPVLDLERRGDRHHLDPTAARRARSERVGRGGCVISERDAGR